MKDSSFKNNAATNGGVLFDSNQKSIELDNCIFANNKATKNGGVIYSTNNIVVKNSRFTGNTANYGSTVYSKNSFILFFQ
ncbi:hypothetical protein ALNOE001_03970 [Candidatus Methanobinarius endosymbioticus]|uniref:Right handed beta helix domain-containing protein n=1 Tax=Candidatus Methanobinarius endosymbioticus TaxID=2006182 RepID=A0A366MD45_9EURY|nr:hypothetical protein ALNOE001_03970 [Candidatus Methanobinarius endosymbioticus]